MPFSAPGKAFFAGGYLVLESEYEAYCLALSSRMHSVAHPRSDGRLVIKSAQFDSEWVYRVNDVVAAGNPFLDAVVQTCTAYFGPLTSGAVHIYSDDGFHSQSESRPHATFPRFKMHGKPITKVPKTGLGSSASLTVVAIAAIAELQGLADRTDLDFLDLVHKLAQVAHCSAQGKVGSGFDVAVAVYGSVRYSRFSKELIPSQLTSDLVKFAVNQSWDYRLRPCALPDSLSLLMGDVVGGSETPAMVRQVLQWRTQNTRQAQDLWAKLDSANTALVDALEHNDPPSDISVLVENIRKNIREVTRLTNVPIEPPAQTARLDAASSIDGVIGGVVPGAGGEDAICLLVETAKLASAKSQLRVHPDLASVRWLDVAQEARGLVQESMEYPCNEELVDH